MAKTNTTTTTTTTTKATKPALAANGKTIRQRIFELLAKTPSTGGQVKEKLCLTGVPMILKDEGVCAKPRIRRKVVEGVRGVVYELTAAGKSDLKAGKVNENAAPASNGVEWND